MARNIVITALILLSLVTGSQALADDPIDPSTGERVVPAGGLSVVTVVVGSTSGGTWSDFSMNDDGVLDLILVSKNGIPVHPGDCTNSAGGERIMFLVRNPTASDIDVTVTMNFMGGLACPPL